LFQRILIGIHEASIWLPCEQPQVNINFALFLCAVIDKN